MITTIPQLLVRLDHTGPVVVAKSDGIAFAEENLAITIAAKYGTFPDGRICEALFKCHFDKRRVAVVRVQCSANVTLFRFLILDLKVYDTLGDPFFIDEQFPVDWKIHGAMASLELKNTILTAPTIDAAQNALKTKDNSSLLLGGTQALIDGTRVLIQRPEPDDELFRSYWLLLPLRSRGELNVASFAPTNDLGFHLAVLPRLPEPMTMGYITDEQARDYPPGRYELSLQTAIESGNQADYLVLLHRRSSQETLRLAMLIVIAAIVLALVSKLI